ncbi:MAG: hypothetical protein ACYCWW_18605 [Deltaproteobacteria bacterium]
MEDLYGAYSYDVAMAEARDLLLDALAALEPHREALIVVGAQAVYEHTRLVEGLEQPSTSDSDLAVDPSLVTPSTSIYQALLDAGLFPARPDRSGIYSRTPTLPGGKPHLPTLDLIAPESVAGSSRSHRGARIAGQDRRAVSKADGLEMALLDFEWRRIGPIAGGSGREEVEVKVAGAAALLCAKAWKLYERVRDAEAGKPWRLREKDAGDIWHLMYVSDPDEVRETFERCSQHQTMGQAVRTGQEYLAGLFGAGGRGRLLAARNLADTRTETEVVELVERWMESFQAGR